MDQNEKLGMFDVTHVVAVDGNSSKIVANATMPVKKNLIIYDEYTGESYTTCKVNLSLCFVWLLISY